MKYIIALLLLASPAFAEPINPDDADIGDIAIQVMRQTNRIDKLETDVASIKQRLNTGIQVPAGAVEAPPDTPTRFVDPGFPPYAAPPGFTWFYTNRGGTFRWELTPAVGTATAPAVGNGTKKKEPEPRMQGH